MAAASCDHGVSSALRNYVRFSALDLREGEDTGGGGDIHVSRFQSYHTPDPFGWDLQISNITFETRTNT